MRATAKKTNRTARFTSANKYKIALIAVIFAVVGVALVMQSRANPNLPGDINNDNVVNINDLSILLSNWGKRYTPTPGPTPPGPSPTPPGPTPQPGTAQYPADITGKNWKVTLPVLDGGKVKEVKPTAYYTYSDKFFMLNSAKNGVLFRAYYGGGTTENSKNPRSELRERVDDDPEGYWSCASGSHSMTVRGKVNRLTKVRPHTVIAQIHGGDDDVTVFRVEGSTLYVTNGDDTHWKTVTTSFKLNTEYTVGFSVSGGTITHKYNGQTVGSSIKSSDSSCYFKAGAYLQSNSDNSSGESTSEYTEVEMFEVKVSH